MRLRALSSDSEGLGLVRAPSKWLALALLTAPETDPVDLGSLYALPPASYLGSGDLTGVRYATHMGDSGWVKCVPLDLAWGSPSR
jgi:hypothetical protein